MIHYSGNSGSLIDVIFVRITNYVHVSFDQEVPVICK